MEQPESRADRPLRPPPPKDSRKSHWPWAVAAVVIVALLVGAGLYVFHSLRQIPGELAEGGREVMRQVRDVASAFRTGTITTIFRDQVTEIEGTNYLQIATLRGTEMFERTEEVTILWGSLDLPDLVVAATAPVEYTYYVDLNGEWTFETRDRTLRVLAPPIEANKPAIDASEIHYEVQGGGLLRDTENARQRLQAGLTEMSRSRARQNVALVREVARRKVEEFVANWLAGRFDDGEDYHVDVLFADERAAGERTLEGWRGERSATP